jgi:hypothetical protein
MEVKQIPIFSRIIAQVSKIRGRRKPPKSDHRDLAREERCYFAGEAALKELEQIKSKGLIECASVSFYR